MPSAVGPWPLNIPPRSLAVLAHILLRQQQRSGGAARRRQAWEEEDEGGHKDIVTCMQVWERFLGTLTDRAVKGEPITEPEGKNLWFCWWCCVREGYYFLFNLGRSLNLLDTVLL